MGAWGGGLGESDQDQDLLCDIYGMIDEKPYEDDASDKVRAKLDGGEFDRLFEKFKNMSDPYNGTFFMSSGNYHCVILSMIAAQVGAKINNEHKEYLRSKYNTCGLYKEGIWQFGKLLDNYEAGEKYKLEEPDRTEEKAINDEINRGGGVQLMNHLGPRIYENGPVPDMAYTMIKKTMTHRAREQAREETHPHPAWRAPATPSCCGCGKKATDVHKPLKRCSRCRVALYCTRDCQKKDHKLHKKACAGLAAEAARADEK